jgi:probable HAF family extracellular repeat protein
MKRITTISLSAVALSIALALPIGLAAQQHRHYKLVNVGTFGGPNSFYYNLTEDANIPVLNHQGTLVGAADTPASDTAPNQTYCFQDCYVAHAFQLRNGIKTDLGVLSSLKSSAATAISANGLIAGDAENGEIDPLVPDLPEFRAVLWNNGHIMDLGTLPEGGNESGANSVNSLGQVVGWAVNTTPDPSSFWMGFGFQTRAFLWQHGVMQDLGTLDGGTDAQAFLINEQGQILGVSYKSSSIASAYCYQYHGFSLATYAFLWQKGEMKDLGSFGGTCTYPTDLNNRGEVVGVSNELGDTVQDAFLWDGSLHKLTGTLGGNVAAANSMNELGDAVGFASLPGDQTYHASLWKYKHTMTDLGTLDNDPSSFAQSINAAGQVVGFTTQRAFLWEKGSMVDLNNLIPAHSTLYLTAANRINDRGEIAGSGVDTTSGNQYDFLLIPCDEHHPNVEGCDYNPWDGKVNPAAAPATTANTINPMWSLRRGRQMH